MLRWLRNWWRSDRIRFAPGHFLLLQLEVGNRVLVRNRLWRLTDRQSTHTFNNVMVQMSLQELDSSAMATLQIRFNESGLGLPIAYWSDDMWSGELLEEDAVPLSLQHCADAEY
jgi:hypothetical protein